MSILQDATARIEGYVDVNAEQGRISRLRSDMIRADWGARFREADANYSDTLATSHDIAEIRAAFDAREAARSGLAAFQTMQNDFNALSQNLRAAGASVSPDALAPALTFLHEQLGKLMAYVRELDTTLGPVTTIDAALRSTDDVIRAWRDIDTAADEYEAIRSAQNTITVSMSGSSSPMLSQMVRVTGRLSNAFEMESFWAGERKRTRRTLTRYNGEFVAWVANPPAPDWLRLESETWPNGDRIAYLRWLATTGHPWVPTIAQVERAHADLTAMNGPLSTAPEVEAAVDAFDSYYTRRGITPIHPLDASAIRADLPAARGLRAHRDEEDRPKADPRILAAYE